MIYFIRDTSSGHIKVGYTAAKPLARLSSLQIGTSARLELVGVIDGERADEKALHEALSVYREGGEWFRPCALLDFAMRAARPVERPERTHAAKKFWNGRLQREVAEEIGVSSPLLSHIRSGLRRAAPDVALAIQRATGVSALQLVFGADAEEVIAGYGGVKRDAA